MLVALALWVVPQLWSWAVVHAVWVADPDACHAVRGQGACWGLITEKHRLILFGRYPYEAQWRPVLASGILAVLLVGSGMRACWRPGLWLPGCLACWRAGP